jgi:predicted N-acyltransferase
VNADAPLVARLAGEVGSIPARDWDRLVDTGAGPGRGNPFMRHAFLSVMEESGSVGDGTGWSSAAIVIDGDDGAPIGALPAYLKAHSQGEYVFDHAWADAYERAGGRYYPKLQIAAPFTPATGPRILTRNALLQPALLNAAQNLCEANGISGAHATFIEPAQVPIFEQAGWLLRHDIQFHWHNRDYADFDGFLADLSSRKRKDLRKERRAAGDGLHIERLVGDAIRPEHWDAFWVFYQDTGARKWGTPYLTRAAFDLLGERMGDQIMLILAFDDDRPIAGALNFIGDDALYGRYWGCVVDRPFLHFELCYYQAIDAAIELGLARVEAGAQGGHKLARGYEPVETTSAHYIVDPGFREAVAQFLDAERRGVAADRLYLGERTPFKKGG